MSGATLARNSPSDFKIGPDCAVSDTSQGASENEPNLKMAERPDWALFRNIDGLQQKAGVPAARLRRLVLKELADNAPDRAFVLSATRW